jgi:ABC-2 type transport system permease protein
MKMIGLIARREYAENVKTKGFWLTVAIFPIIIVGMLFLQTLLSDATPTRFYLVIDESGNYSDAVSTAIEREHQRRILQAFVTYLLEHRIEGDLETTAANASSNVDQMIDDVDADEVSALNEWIDNGGLDYALLMASPYLEADAPPFEPPEPQFVAAEMPGDVDPGASQQEIVAALRPYFTGARSVSAGDQRGELFALIYIPENVDQSISRPGTMPQAPGTTNGVQYWSRNLTDSRLPDAISASINSEIRAREYLLRGIDASQIRDIQRTRLPFSRLDPTAEEGEEEVSIADTFRQYAPLGFVYLMFVSLMQNVQYLLSNTIEEKSNRIIEVLLASVTADELMLGKLVGIGLAGLTTIAAWLLSFFVFLEFYSSIETETISEILDVILGSDLIPWFVFYYFAGYALYSGVFLAIGSLCNTLKEAQALMMPMILIQVVPLAMMAYVIVDPHNPIVRAMSWFPLFTPYLMMNRAAANPPMVDVVGTSIVLVLSIGLLIWGSGKIFRQGILRTGQPPKLLEMWRMLTAQH